MTEEKKLPEVGEYKGKKILTLNPGEKYIFSFGLQKAKLIVEHFDAIKKFVEENSSSTSE